MRAGGGGGLVWIYWKAMTPRGQEERGGGRRAGRGWSAMLRKLDTRDSPVEEVTELSGEFCVCV